jgi:2-methylisocitrate lyase-like PEP mutase family enzyme
MTTQAELAAQFAALHIKGDPLVLFNCWDAGTARLVADAGAKAVATGSWAVAAAHGYDDGEKIPLDLAVANLRRIVAAVSLPVTFDMESGYGSTPSSAAATASKVIEAGAVGINFEDQIVGENALYDVEDQAARIDMIRSTAQAADVPLFINARTDIFLLAPVDQHDAGHVQDAIRRANAFAEAGAGGFFAPGVADERHIAALVEGSPLPLNVLVTAHTPPLRRLADLGVARVSFGGGTYRRTMERFTAMAQAALELK